MMGAISVEQAAMAATMASHDGPTRRLKQASAGAVQQAMSSFASALPTIQNLGMCHRACLRLKYQIPVTTRRWKYQV